MTRLLAVFAAAAFIAVAQPEGWTAHRDMRYVSFGTERQTLDLYLPPDAPGAAPRPLVIWIHGGAWRAGSKQNPLPLRLIPDAGYAIASVNYRLSQMAKFSAQIEDCKAAVRWLRANAKQYKLDASRFAVWGSSAGGHLAALLGTSDGKFDIGENLQFSSGVQAVVDYFGPTDFMQMDGHALAGAPFRHDAPDSPESQLLGGPLMENDLMAARANPIHYASRNDPPFLIVHGDKDPQVPLHQSQLLETALRKAGVDVTLYVVAGAGHGQGFERDARIVPMVKEFLARTLRR